MIVDVGQVLYVRFYHEYSLANFFGQVLYVRFYHKYSLANFLVKTGLFWRRVSDFTPSMTLKSYQNNIL